MESSGINERIEFVYCFVNVVIEIFIFEFSSSELSELIIHGTKERRVSTRSGTD